MCAQGCKNAYGFVMHIYIIREMGAAVFSLLENMELKDKMRKRENLFIQHIIPKGFEWNSRK